MPVGAASENGREHQGAGTDGDEAARLAAAWAAEAPAITDWRRTPVQPSGHACGECGGPMVWHSAHTTLACLTCPTSDVSPGAAARAEAHAAADARRQGRAEVAVINPDAEARARAARIDLHRKREMLRECADKALTWCDAEYEYPQDARLAAELGATLRGYLPEIDKAPDIATLAAILGEIRAIRDGDEFTALTTAYKQDQQREAERNRAEAWQRAEEQRRAAEETQAAREAEAEQRRAAAEARQLEQQQRRQLPAARTVTTPLPAPTGYLLAAQQIAAVVVNRQARKEAEVRLREQHGTCGWCQGTPRRLYALSKDGGNNWHPGLQNAKACPKHYDTADQWIEQQAGYGFKAFYWELTTT